MNDLQSDIREKRAILRGVYGGMMSLEDLSRELRVNKDAARGWAQSHGIGNLIDRRRVKYETDVVAKIIVLGRGMC